MKQRVVFKQAFVRQIQDFVEGCALPGPIVQVAQPLLRGGRVETLREGFAVLRALASEKEYARTSRLLRFYRMGCKFGLR